MVQQTIDEWGRIDILVNNAEFGDKVFKGTFEDFELVINASFKNFKLYNSVFQIMREQEGGRIYLPVHHILKLMVTMFH